MSSQWQFVAAAYGVTWVVLVAYAAYVARRWRRARSEIEGGSP